MRRVAVCALVCVVLGSIAVSWVWAGGKTILATSVVCTSSAITNVIRANPSRSDLTLQNVGTLHINVGGQLPGTNAGSFLNFRGITLHVNSSITFKDYQGGVDCMTQQGTGSSTIEVLEEFQ